MTNIGLCSFLVTACLLVSCTTAETGSMTRADQSTPHLYSFVRVIYDPSKPHNFYCLPDKTSYNAEELKQESYNQNATFDIKCSEMITLQRSALSGNGDAAKKLADFFIYRMNDEDAGFYWLSIAAENGNKIAQHDLSQYLRLSDISEFRTRAQFWLDKSGDK